MIVAGIGFRRDARLSSLLAALAAAGGLEHLAAAGGMAGITALATSDAKATSPLARALTLHLGLPLRGIPAALLAAQATLTHSPRIMAEIGAGSLAEAAALAAAGPGARLLGPRAVSPDRMATAALAQGPCP